MNRGHAKRVLELPGRRPEVRFGIWERSGWRAGSGCSGRWSSRTCPRKFSSPRSLRPEPALGDRTPARPLPALAGRRAHPASVWRRRRRPERTHRRDRLHEHRSLCDQTAGPRSSQARHSETESAFRFCSPAASRASTTSACTCSPGACRLERLLPDRPREAGSEPHCLLTRHPAACTLSVRHFAYRRHNASMA